MITRKKFKRILSRLFNKTPHMKYVYGFYYKYKRIKKNTVLIESFHGKTIGDSSLVFAKEIRRLYADQHKIFFATEDMQKHKKFIDEIGLDVELVDIRSFKYLKVLASAEHIISNASLPIYYIRKEGQTYLQTWHGTPLKTLGKKMREGIESMYNVQHNFLQASHITFPNEFTRKVIMDDYNLERLYTGKVVMAGYPRNSVFLGEDRSESIRKSMGTTDKTVYAYMPTWRGKNNHAINNTGYLEEVREIFRKLDKSMRDDQLMYVNFHPILKGAVSFKKYKHILPFPSGIDSYEFLNSVDALVTDYSSVFFDFSLTKKPILLFMYDYDDYMSERGMYMDVADLPFRQIREVEEFCNCIRDDKCLSDSYEDTEYFNKFFKYDDKNIATKLLELVWHEKDTGLQVDDYAKNKDQRLKVYLPECIKTESDFRTLAEIASGEDDVVMMYRKWFYKADIGAMLYDKYNDAINYVITTNTPPRTYIEQFLAKLNSQKHARIIRERDIKRSFPNLDIGGDYIEDFGCIGKGYKADLTQSIPVESEVINGDNGAFIFKAEIDSELDCKKAVILDDSDAIVYERDLTDVEISENCFEYDLTQVIESLAVYDKEVATPGIIAIDASGDKKLLVFNDSKKAEKGRQIATKNLKTGLSYTPNVGTYKLPESYFVRNLRKIRDSFVAFKRDALSKYNMNLKDTELFITPFFFYNGKYELIRLRVSSVERAIYSYSDNALLKSYRLNRNELKIKAYLPDWKAEDIVGAALILDSKSESVTIPMMIRTRPTARGCLAYINLHLNDSLPLIPIRWNCRIEVKIGEYNHYLRIKVPSIAKLARLKLGNAKAMFSNGNVLFPYAGIGDIFKLYYRQASEYDTVRTRVKEIAALILFVVLYPYFKRKGLYIVYEKFSQTAQDNSLYFFKYCMDNLSGKARDKFYYVIDKREPDYDRVKEYEPKIIQFMSLKHMLYAMSARLCISTDSTTHLYAWQSRPSFVFDRIHEKGVLFLQHGVTALKRVDRLFGKKGSSPMKYFVTTSEIEQRIIVDNFGYREEDAPMVGFARWDVLHDEKSSDDRMILVMPTWRQWLEDADDETFKESVYFERYTKLLSDSRLSKMLEDGNTRMVLYLHPKFASYIDAFKESLSKRIECISMGEMPLNNLMMKCHLLITDYSSVCWDVLYMDKPVLFYHFDSEMYLNIHGSYINFETDLPGARETEHDKILDQIQNYINNNFVIKDEHKAMIPKYFEYRDNNNCARTYNYLINREELGLN